MTTYTSGAPSQFSAASLVSEAAKFLGDPYVYGAAGPSTFDCSGLVQYALTQLGLKGVPRTSEEQWAWVTKISANELQPGDLVFGNFAGEVSPGHVVIYAGDNQVIDAPQTGQKVQKISLTDAFSGGSIVGYGRVPDTTQPGGTDDATLTSAIGGLQMGQLGSDIADPLLGTMMKGVGWITGFATETDSVAKGIGGVANDISEAMNWASFLFMPSSWLRVGAFFAGVILLIMGGMMLAKATGAMPQVTPVPV
jgi:NlpC/P60 family protein